MKQICIIKLGAMGDVVRTLPILEAIKEKYPDSTITWVTKKNVQDIFQNNQNVDNLIILPNTPNQKFDIVYNFDIEDDATNLAQELDAEKKLGFYAEGGYAAPFNMSAEYYLNTIFDDELKKYNKKTYQEMMFDAAELEYKKQKINIFLTDENKNYAKNFIEKNNITTENLIGLNIGSSPRWPSKVWSNEKIKEFIIKANEYSYKILLFGGPNEKGKLPILLNEMKDLGIEIYANDPNNSLMEFASLISICDKMICPDSLSLHISLALKKPTIGMFFCTSANEVEDYNLLTKIISNQQKDFFPEKMDEYSEELINSITTDEVLNALKTKVATAIIKNKEGKFLTIKRNGKIHNEKWAFPGGIIESNETEEDALKREIDEEVGLKISNIIKQVSEYNYQRPDKTDTIGKCFLVETENYEVKINDEISEYKWVTLNEFNNLNHIEGLENELIEASK